MNSVECHLHALMCSVSIVTVVFIHTMEDDQRLYFYFSIAKRRQLSFSLSFLSVNMNM